MKTLQKPSEVMIHKKGANGSVPLFLAGNRSQNSKPGQGGIHDKKKTRCPTQNGN